MKLIKFFFITILFISFNANSNNICKEFTLSNYKNIFNNNIEGLFKNPFHQKQCFYLSFSTKNIENKVNEVSKVYSNKIVQESYRFFKMPSLEVNHFYLHKTQEYFNSLQYDKDSIKHDLILGIKENQNYLYINNYLSEIYFLHEVFHLKNIDTTKEYFYDEVHSDIFAGFVISKVYNLGFTNTLNLMGELFKARGYYLDYTFSKEKEYSKYYKETIRKVMKDYKMIINFNSFDKLKKNIKKVLTNKK
tara:strand:- start:22514 stop:23257 length:744 start_codon:yes stop_codon:yes gene_type:complete